MTKSGSPRVGVVIPGHDSGRTLRPCLDALLPLLQLGAIHRIVFVDDHSTDNTREIAREYPVQILSSPRRGAGAARNTGWRATDTELIWFVDSDCVAHADALGKLQHTMRELQAAVVGGSYSNQNRGRLTADLIHEEMVMRHRAMGAEVTFAITANLLCQRETLEALGGFDERLRLGQDLDFAYRVVQSGRKLGFDASSLVGHFHETRFSSYLHKQARQGFWRMHIYRRHPRRMSGDTYSGPLDYIQPPLALLALGAPACGVGIGIPWLGLGPGLAAGAALLACQVPLARDLVQHTAEARYWAYVPFGAARAAARGVGMLLGVASLFRGDARDMDQPVSAGASGARYASAPRVSPGIPHAAASSALPGR